MLPGWFAIPDEVGVLAPRFDMNAHFVICTAGVAIFKCRSTDIQDDDDVLKVPLPARGRGLRR